MAVANGSILFYCRRAQREFVAIDAAGNQIPVDMSPLRERKEWIERNFNPYGVAYDSVDQSLWIANKYDDCLLNVKPVVNESLQLVFKRAFSFPRQLSLPCGLALSPEGIWVGCFGANVSMAGVFLVSREGAIQRIDATPKLETSFAHTCSLTNNQIAYVARLDMSLWINEASGKSPRLVSSTQKPVTPKQEGSISTLSFQYVQGMHWSTLKQRLFISDACLGCIFELDLANDYYRIIAGVPAISDSSWTANLKPGNSDKWLGPIRGLTEDGSGNLAFLDGETGIPWTLDSNSKIAPLSRKVLFKPETIIGTGMTYIPVN